MTGYESKRAAARDKLDDNDALTIAYQSGYYDGKKAAQRPWVGLSARRRLMPLKPNSRIRTHERNIGIYCIAQF